MTRTEIIVPASTSNLGASFDTCGLALKLYLKVTVEERAGEFEITPSGEGADAVARDESNLIARVARFVADSRGRNISGARLRVESQIPLARGLGSSGCAIIAGISVYEALAGEGLTEEEFFGYALEFEGHGDNLAPSLLGGLVVTCVVDRDNGARSLVAIKRAWPEHVKMVLLIPDFEMETARMRSVLPATVQRSDAVFNLQRAALLQAAISEQRFEFLSEALRDRLHQPYRAPLASGVEEALRLNEQTGLYPGLLGVAVSGAGPTVIAFVTGNSDAIAAAMIERMAPHAGAARTLEVGVDSSGRSIKKL